MATKGFNKSSCGHAFDEQSSGISDLSATVDGALTLGSMAGGNMITEKGNEWYGAPGVPSEQTETNVLGGNLPHKGTVSIEDKGKGNYRKGVK